MGRQTHRSDKQSGNFGSHAINGGSLVAATSGSAINPMNMGDTSNIRTVPVLTKQRTFSREESQALELHEAQRGHQVKHTTKALRALGKLEMHDATEQTAFRGYQGRVAAAELRKVKSNAQLGKTLHGQRAAYAQIGIGMGVAQQQADHDVAVVSARLLG